MSEEIIAMGVKLLSDAATADTFVEVPKVLTLPEFGYEADEVEVTHLNSPGGVKEYKSGLKDGVGSTIELSWVPGDTQQEALKSAATSGRVINFQIQWPDPGQTRVQVPLLLKSFKVVTAIGQKVTVSIDVKGAGAAVWDTWA
ncbi:phage tail tube protein [uncultured Microbulbifer sp.]|uniref:phage tail tube protein n=1 Tax=uncultured Microbulbifer sp. TaxID=348147 RepID=UPI0026289BEF|nr:phage tail tube protein [uncultured Microbulbifer sp.]